MKKFLTLFTLYMSLASSYAVQVVQQNPNGSTPETQTGAVVFLTFIMLTLAGIVFLFVFVAICLKIYKALTDHKRGKKDFLLNLFNNDNAQCNLNRDPLMKKRNPRRIWIFWKRNPVYINTKDGLKEIGGYNGEALKKENFYMIAIHNKLGMFKQIEQIIIIPNKIKHIVKRVTLNKTQVLMLDCEGIDQIGNTDYYFQPLINKPNNDKDYLDFADLVHKEYFEKTIYRDTIKENLMQSREMIISSVESNPYTQFNRRKD